MEHDAREVICQLVQVIGALAILASFALAQAGRLDQSSHLYLGLNLGGSVALAVEAWLAAVGLLILEAAWAAVSAVGLARRFGGAVSSA